LTPGDPLANEGKDTADAKRANLSAIYGDVLGLIQSPPTDPDIAFHFYEGLAELVRKLQGSIGRPLHQLWAAAEELRLLFDAHAVWLNVPEEYRKAPTDTSPNGTIWELGTLTGEEKRLLTPVRDGIFTEQLRRRKAPGIRWDVLDQPLGEHSTGVPKNSNLASVDSVMVVDVPGSTTNTPWRFAAFMEHHACGRETLRGSSRFCEAILPPVSEPPQAQAFRCALDRLDLPFGSVGSHGSDDLDFWPVDRKSFNDESEQFWEVPTKFCDLYRERFRSIHTILDRIYKQMDGLLAAERRTQSADTTLIFSYRAPGEDFICFFPTVDQARSFVNSSDDITDFLYFWQFPYYRSKAISGWVLATGACDYTEKFDTDGRWIDWINRCSDDERPRVERQLALVRKVFRTGQGNEQRFMYLVPIVLRPRFGMGATVSGQLQLQPILMASIGSSRPLTRPLRRELYDLAWQIAPAVEMALFGQMTLEEVYRKEAEIKTVVSFSAGFAHEIGQTLNLLNASIMSLRESAVATFSDLAVRESVLSDVEQAQECVEEISDHQNDTLAIVRLRQGHPPQSVPLDVNALVSTLVTKFQPYCKVMWGDKIQIEASFTQQVAQIKADASLVRIMVRNLLRNAAEALHRRGSSGLIQVSTEFADNAVRIKVHDNGPGMKQSLVEKLKHGTSHSTKPMGLGLGFMLIDLSCKAHRGSFDIRSTLGLGTLVVLQLPASAGEENPTAGRR
jgi:signal transduction histidine kinase